MHHLSIHPFIITTPTRPSHIHIHSMRVHNLARKLAPRPDARAVKHQDPRHHRQQRADAAEQTARGPEAEVVVHLRCEEGEYAAWDVFVS